MLAAVVSQVVRVPLDRLERRLIQVGFSAVRLHQLGLVRGILSTRDAPAKLWRAIPRRVVVGTLGVAAAGFLIGMLGITLLEAAQGRPVSAITTGAPRTGTTAGNLVTGRSASEPTPEPAGAGQTETASPAVPTEAATAALTGGSPAPTLRPGTPTSTAGAATATVRSSTPTPPRGVATATRVAPTPTRPPAAPAPAPTAPVPRTPTAQAEPTPTGTRGS
jgi:hypothetical protein